MRTVTFSDAAVARLLNESFVCAWVNKRPFIKFKDGIYKGQKPAALPNGTAPDNVTSVFAAWDGTVIHAMSGSLDVNDFKRNLVFARDLHDKLYEGVGRKSFAGVIYREAHMKAADNAPDARTSYTHSRLSKTFSSIKDWYPTMFEMLFGEACKD
jgi:hypothetical protein